VIDARVVTATHCPYCALQCGMNVIRSAEGTRVEPNPGFPVNKGGLCLKGWSAATLLDHEERLREPLLRTDAGTLEPVSWDVALGAIASRLRSVQRRFGADSVAVFGGGALTNEAAYLLGKFARVALGTANIDYNGRFCMSSAAAAQNRAFGIDRGLPFPLEDIARAAAVLLVGSNPSETMPPIMQYFEAQQQNGGTLIVADPRKTPTAAWARLHLRLRPGTDAALANGLLHVIARDRLVDEPFVRCRTEGFDAARRIAASYWPERVEQITGVAETALVEAAHILARSPSAMILTARGPEQQSQGVNNALAFINVALALGLPGRDASGFGTLTGQGNGQGGREHGQKADQLPGYRSIQDPDARRHVADVWGIPEAVLPAAGRPAYQLLDSLGRDVHALFVMGSNPAVSAPDALRIERKLAAIDTLVVCDFFLSETARLAHVVLPAAQWAEQEGTTTNLEGRVIRRRRAADPPTLVRSDLQILSSLAAALGRADGFRHDSAESVFRELGRASAGGIADYSGITYDSLDGTDGTFWPCPSTGHGGSTSGPGESTVGHGGSSRLFKERFHTASGRARFHATPHRSIGDERDFLFPLLLTTGRLLSHYQSGTQTRRVAALREVADEPCAEIHPVTASNAGLVDGARVRLTTRRGSAVFRARLTRAIREDTVFVPFHWGGELAINRLTSAALDPTSGMPEFKACAVRIEPAGVRS
jgi:assimilatory nitrate reductase catalytic subunit